MPENHHRALVPGSAHLPAVIEKRTRMVNRVMGELTSRDTEAFFRRHPEFFRLVVSRYYPLSEELIRRYADFWDWDELSQNKILPWNEDFIERFSDRWDWGNSGPGLSTFGLSWNKGLPWSETLIERFADRWDWDYLGWNEVGLPWSEVLIKRFADRWNWQSLSRNKAVPSNEVLIAC